MIIGTAGHIDHGKTSLIQALTGIDADRLQEEKRRGITIDLGFAHIDLDGKRIGIIDVPGHERFIKNMLAGAGEIDFALLVVAADDGIMPQTLEHLDILCLLGVQYGIVVITKTDLVTPERVASVRAAIQPCVRGTFLEKSAVIAASSCTGEGIEDVKAALLREVKCVQPKSGSGDFCMPIDRVFTIKGAGTVVTGTVASGEWNVSDDELMVYPQKKTVRLREMQSHGEKTDRIFRGQRAAVNLAGVKKEEIGRGDILAAKESRLLTNRIDVKLEMTKHVENVIKNNCHVLFYHGAKEIPAKVVLMDCEKIEAGESGYAQILLSRIYSVQRDDRFIIREGNPMVTAGGGVILDCAPFRKRRYRAETLEAFRIKEEGTDQERLFQAVRELDYESCNLQEMAKRIRLPIARVQDEAQKLYEEQKIWYSGRLSKDTIPLTMERKHAYEKRIRQILLNYHRKHPDREGMYAEDIAAGLCSSKIEITVLRGLIQTMYQEKELNYRYGYLSLPDFKPQINIEQLTEEDGQLLFLLEEEYRNAGLHMPANDDCRRKYYAYKRFSYVRELLIKEKKLICLDERYLIHKDQFEEAKTALIHLYEQCDIIRLGDYRDILGTSRKIALALLEYFDREGLTKKTEPGRILINR